MKKDFTFETFLLNEEIGITEYLSAAASCVDSEAYMREVEKLKKLYEKYPKVERVLDWKESQALTEEECEALVQGLAIRNEIDLMESREVYFKGCADAAGYLKMMKLV